MKAILFDTPGDVDVLHFSDAPDPLPGSDEVLVRVRAAGINRADLMQRRGGYAPPPGASEILGLELAGEIAETKGVWQAGDRVMAVVTGGSYAELAAVPEGMLMRVPDQFTWEQAGALPEAFLTAYMNLFELGKLQAGETVLIHAGASGVGTAAIQLARSAGARVITTAGSEDKLQRCRELGATVTINYKTQSFTERVKEATDGQGVNLVIDFVGVPYWNSNLQVLARGGRLVMIGLLGGAQGQIDIGTIMNKNLTVTGTTLRRTLLLQKTKITSDFVAFAMPRFASGELQPVLDSTFPLSNAADAHRAMEANSNTGKIVLLVE